MNLRIAPIPKDALEAAIPAIAALRIAVFRDFPYLYDGDLAYEETYLATYRDSPDSVVVGAWDGEQLVGAATATPLEDHADDFGAPFHALGYSLSDIFYCAESVLLPAYRGQGVGHRFFDLREAAARDLGRRHVTFCSVLRATDHPARPIGYRPLDGFWRKRGFAPLPGAIAEFCWKDLGDTTQTAKKLQFWIRAL